MEPRELQDKLTPVTVEDLWNAFVVSWETLGVDQSISRRAIELKIEHVHFETGLTLCHNYNLGNIKSRVGDGRNWQFFACGEEIPAADLDRIVAMGPGLVQVKARYSKKIEGQSVPYLSIKLYPKHPWSRFRAFESLSQGAEEQLIYLRKRPEVLKILQTGDVVQYNLALLAARYYTGDTNVYLRGLKDRLRQIKQETDQYDWGEVE